MGTTSFTAAAAQLTSTENLEANLAHCAELAKQAKAAGATLFALPENFAFLGLRERDKFGVAETIDEDEPGPILSALQAMARDHDMWVAAGGMPERLDDEPPGTEVTKTYNTFVLLSADGRVEATYRKIHLFDIDIPDRAVLRESDSVAPGSNVVAAETPLATLGLTICYDLRFPELYRQLAVDMNAQILLVPAAFTAHTGKYHWHALLRARAIENQCWLIAAAQTGRHNDKRASYGHSLIIDPWGTIVAEREDGMGIITAQIDLAKIDETRARMPCFDHRRL